MKFLSTVSSESHWTIGHHPTDPAIFACLFSRASLDLIQTSEVGFCSACGSVLKPMDYLECAACYAETKKRKRRYGRAAAHRQLDRTLERVKTLSTDPTLCHWVPDAAILFGSLLNADATSVGDVDLCVLGDAMHRKGMETFQAMKEWAIENSPASFDSLRVGSYPSSAARRFIRGRDSLIALTLQNDFSVVGGGRPFPYRVIWTRTDLNLENLVRAIEDERPKKFAESIAERKLFVELVMRRKDAGR